MIFINVLAIQDKLINDAESIINILIKLGFEESSIKELPNQSLIKVPRPGGDNPSGLLIYTNSLQVVGTTRAEYTGNIFTLVMKVLDCSFPKALEFIAKTVDMEDINYEITPPFGGFYKQLSKNKDDNDYELPSYSEDKLPPKTLLSKKFLDDNISLIVQEDWGVRYSEEDDAILIPIYSNNNLVGCKARANSECDYNHRWWAYMPYSKTKVVYGYDKNYQNIVRKNKCIITESEKGVLQLSSMNVNVGLAIAGHSISNAQAKLIKSLGASEIIVAFDQDIPEDEVRYEASKLQIKGGIMKNKVSYVYDKSGIYLPKGSKMSPTDSSVKTFKDLIKQRKEL